MSSSPENHASFADVISGADGTGRRPPTAIDTAIDSDERIERGSRLDDWWAKRMSSPRAQRLWYWGAPLVVLLIAAVARFWNLGHPHALVFDETFYVKDAYTLLNNGYESAWPEDPDASFNAGNTDIFLDDPSYVVHPPLGKWLIAIGLALFGADSSFGWRVSTALLGVLAVGLIMLVARRLFASTAITMIAGLLFAIDGHAIVMSRVAILDSSLMFFALLGFFFVLLDRPWHERRLADLVAAARIDGTGGSWGPAIWWRPWLLAAGLAFGAATAVKWSGLYFLAAFGLYLIMSDALARRRAGLDLWVSASILKQGPVTFLLFVPVALLVYLASWTGWFVTDGGYDRQWAEHEGNQLGGPLGLLPPVMQSFVHYHQSMYSFHVGLNSSHPYAAHPAGWLAMLRPTSMWFEQVDGGAGDCGAKICDSAITSIANPLIWWAGAAALIYLVYRLIRYREWRPGFILMGIVAGYLPWLLYSNRTVFQFYTIAFEPYLILALAFAISIILGGAGDERYRRTSGIAVTTIFLITSVLLSLFWFPLWTATAVPHWFWMLHNWLPTWI